MSQPIIILGADGLLGGALLESFTTQSTTVIGWDKANVDVTNNAELIAKISPLKPQVIINATAYNSVDRAEQDAIAFALAKSINETAVGNLAKLSNSLGCPLVHFSTDYVFDGTNKNGYTEEMAPSPQNKYGQTKAGGEALLQRYTEQFYLVRLSRMFGRPGKSPGAKKSFVDIMIDAAAANPEKEIRLVDEEVSCPTYSTDLARFVFQLLKNKKPFGIYHGANSGTSTWYSLATEIFRLKQLPIKLIPISNSEYQRPAKRPMFSQLINTKTTPQRLWSEALREYLQV